MAQAKTPRHICIIRPGIWADDSFNELGCQAKLLWLGLAGFLDCAGRAVFDPEHIAAQIFPGQAVPFHDLFDELEIMEMIERYQVDGVTYIQMAGFETHQRADKRRVSKLPDQKGRIAEPRTPKPAAPVTRLHARKPAPTPRPVSRRIAAAPAGIPFERTPAAASG